VAAAAPARALAAALRPGAGARAARRLGVPLRAAGRAAEAALALRHALAAPELSAEKDLWNLWLAIELKECARPPADVLAGLRPPGTVAPAACAGDLAWLLERLVEGKGVRIDCGGGETTTGGATWGADRFFTSGAVNLKWHERPEEHALDRTQRWFPRGRVLPSGYRIPLPPGRWDVTLFFAETFFREKGKRVFDASVEGKEVLAAYDIFAAAGAWTLDRRAFPAVEVADGLLEIDFFHIADNPTIAAIEIAPAR